MAPVRRYLRISKHSVLECRIFLENPADGPRWLLSQKDPALPRVFEAVKPLVLPKLREENERAKSKGKKKKKSVKDVVVRDDFEVSVFLTDVGTRHALLVKEKTFQDKPEFGANPNTSDDPVMVEEDSDEDEPNLRNIPIANDEEENDDADTLLETGSRLRTGGGTKDRADDKKKMGFTTSYNGFAIWGKALCLLVERKGGPGRKAGQSADGGAQALMQEWITASQQQRELDET